MKKELTNRGERLHDEARAGAEHTITKEPRQTFGQGRRAAQRRRFTAKLVGTHRFTKVDAARLRIERGAGSVSDVALVAE